MAGAHNSLRHLNSHIDALHALSTAAQRLAEALLAGIPTENTDPSGNGACICSERPAAPVVIDESIVLATVSKEDVPGTHQVEAARGNTSNRDEQVPERRPAQAPDITTSNTSSSPAAFITQGPFSQDLSSGHGEGGTRPGESSGLERQHASNQCAATSPGTSGAVYEAGNYQPEAEMQNTAIDSYSAPVVALSSPSYDHPGKPDRSPESLREEAFNTRSSVGEDGKDSTYATGPSGGDTIEPTDAVNTNNNETTVSAAQGEPVYSVRREDDEGDQSRDRGGDVSAREGTEDGGSGDHP